MSLLLRPKSIIWAKDKWQNFTESGTVFGCGNIFKLLLLLCCKSSIMLLIIQSFQHLVCFESRIKIVILGDEGFNFRSYLLSIGIKSMKISQDSADL